MSSATPRRAGGQGLLKPRTIFYLLTPSHLPRRYRVRRRRGAEFLLIRRTYAQLGDALGPAVAKIVSINRSKYHVAAIFCARTP